MLRTLDDHLQTTIEILTPQGRKPGWKMDFMNDPVVLARRERALSRSSADHPPVPFPSLATRPSRSGRGLAS
ncbi:hypothetical protein C6558_33070 [Ensifer sp. NM-2]|nr:hypothetical protein C6558_33070 [Ensifer sp. NM-2]